MTEDDLNEPATKEELDEALRGIEKALAEAKAAERPYVIPGLDVPWWDEYPPYRVWTTGAGLVGAMSAGFSLSMNGYVLLPKRHPWRDLNLQGGRGWIDIPVHGSITFGPHVTGWIGFDTGHACDVWDLAHLDTLDPPIPADTRMHWQKLIELDFPRFNLGPTVRWNLDRLIDEVEHLAQLALEASR